MPNLIDTMGIESAFNDLMRELEHIKDLNEQIEIAKNNSENYLKSSVEIRKGTELLSNNIKILYQEYKDTEDIQKEALRYILKETETIQTQIAKSILSVNNKLEGTNSQVELIKHEYKKQTEEASNNVSKIEQSLSVQVEKVLSNFSEAEENLNNKIDSHAIKQRIISFGIGGIIIIIGIINLLMQIKVI